MLIKVFSYEGKTIDYIEHFIAEHTETMSKKLMQSFNPPTQIHPPIFCVPPPFHRIISMPPIMSNLRGPTPTLIRGLTQCHPIAMNMSG